MSNIFGGNTGLSYEQAKRLRERALAMRGGQQRPRTIGQGLSALGEGLASGLMERRANKKIGESKEKATSVFQGLFGGGGQSRGTDFNPGASQPSSGMFGQKEQEYGLPSGYLARTAQIESSNDPNAQNPNSSAGGLFQFIDSTAKQYGLTDKTDPVASTDAAARLAADNAAVLRQRLGRDPSPAELYLAHQQGAGGAVALLSNPNAPAVSVVGRDAVRLNGGDENMTAGQFAGLWTGKFGGQGRASTRNPGQGTQVAGGGSTVQRLMQAAATPGMSEQQKSIIGMMLQQRLQQQDPMRQMQMERAQLELEQMRNRPAPDRKTIKGADGRNYYMDTQEPVLPNVQAQPKRPDVVDINGQSAMWNGQQYVPVEGFAPEQDGARPMTPEEMAVFGISPDSGSWIMKDGVPSQLTDGSGSDMTESERRIFMFNNIQQQTGPAINRIEDVGFNPANLREKLADGVLAGNWFKSQEGQMYNAAAGAWSESALRLATGAAATPEEYNRIRNMYFAQAGDEPQTIQFKRRMREAYQGVLEQTLSGEADPNAVNPLMFALDQIYTKDGVAQGVGNKQGSQPNGGGQGQSQGAMDFSNMGVAEVGQVDIMSLTDEQMDALERRMQELGL